MKRIKIIEALSGSHVDSEVTVMGWVRTKRGNKNVAFVALNDGSIIHNLQVVFDLANFSEEELQGVTTGAGVSVTGKLVASMGKGQTVELQASSLIVYGTADPESYPLQKKGHSLEFLRSIAHLRPRTNTFGAVLRIRHHMAYAIHHYFHQKGFFYMHAPIITASDAEGAGQMFRVSTLDPNNLPKLP
ncbi:MAG: OB-fold nucleic acid binding domain-containing protein, partial [Sphingobacteriia bacterium]|nr:OB-fold nucleic acid binding domain-containing protein [Sphingobacteriia bacterium]